MPSRSAHLKHFGFAPIGPVNGVQTNSVNAAATWYAFGFVPMFSGTINEFSLFVPAVTGSLGSSDVSLSIYSPDATTGKPSASLTSGTTLSSAIAAGAWGRWTGLSSALTAGVQYWAVVKNLNGTPASNFPGIRSGVQDNLPFWWGGGISNPRGRIVYKSTDSGATWAVAARAANFYRVGWSGGTYEGFPIQNIAAGTKQTGTNEYGIKFTSPPVIINAIGVAGFAAVFTVPTGNVRFRLYTGASSTPTLQGTTGVVAPAPFNSAAQMWIDSYFSSAIAIPASTVCRVTLCDDTAEVNGYGTYEHTFDADANSAALLPEGGTMGKTVTTDGTNFTDTAAVLSPLCLLLDSAGEFTSSGGTSGPVGQCCC